MRGMAVGRVTRVMGMGAGSESANRRARATYLKKGRDGLSARPCPASPGSIPPLPAAIIMETAASSRFAERYKTAGLSVEALRAKGARRRSAAQKENRHRAYRKSRCFEPPLEPHVEEVAPPPLPESCVRHSSRLAMLQRYKEEKSLRKLKEERENPKRVFKVGLYKPNLIPFQDLKPLPPRAPLAKAKISAPTDLRVTRSMVKNKGPQVTLPANAPNFVAPMKVGSVKENKTANSAVTMEARGLQRLSQKAGPKVPTLGKKASKPPVSSRAEKPGSCKQLTTDHKSDLGDEKYAKALPQKGVPLHNSENDHGNQLPVRAPLGIENVEQKVSFAPENYVFAPVPGHDQFKLAPLSPRSVHNFFTSHTWSPANHQSENNSNSSTKVNQETRSTRNAFETKIELSNLPNAPSEDPITTAFEVPLSKPQEPLVSSSNDDRAVHGIGYFRGIVTSETENLILLCQQWEEWADSEVVPDGVKDLLRTAVGQARLLMAERFKQFQGLVDNCEFKTSEKKVTCADLEGFWDMVYFQVEDVKKKFERLKMIQENNWEEPSLPKRTVKKKAANIKAEVGKVNVASKSRFAEVKAALKAKMKREMAGSSHTESKSDLIVFDAGFFRVESPAKTFPACTKSWASRQRSKEQCRSNGCSSTTPTPPEHCVTDIPSQQTCVSSDTRANMELLAMTTSNFVARESDELQSACSRGGIEQTEFAKYLLPRESVHGMAGAFPSPFFNENDTESIGMQDSTHGIELPSEMKSPVYDCVEMASPVSEQPSADAFPISPKVTNDVGLLTPNVIETLTTCRSNSMIGLLAEEKTQHRMNEGSYMSPFGKIKEDSPVFPVQTSLQDLMSFSPSETP
ncbi:disks large-associated protein 5 isoform X2 [Narcine bancroftii]|uniref:disks large-associated protein 5 isoform X2 n=1 Tax=Narcine bancroftii TaxID=1343680 RepID=UPI003831F149